MKNILLFVFEKPLLSKILSVILALLPILLHIYYFNSADAMETAELFESTPFSVWFLCLISSLYNIAMSGHNEKYFNIGYWLNGIVVILYCLPGAWLFIALALFIFYGRFGKDWVTERSLVQISSLALRKTIVFYHSSNNFSELLVNF